MKTIYFTEEGLNDLKKELQELQNQRITAVAELKIYREMGDFSENFAYRAAKLKLSRIDNRLRKLQILIDSAIVKKPQNNGIVDIGSRVLIDDGKQTFEYTIVGSQESNISQKRISCYAPLGEALMGKKADETIKVSTPSGIKEYVIKEIKTPPE